MTTCKEGDLLRCKSGCLVKYVGYGSHPKYRSTPYLISYFNGEDGTRSIDGVVDTGLFGNMTAPFDIISKADSEICELHEILPNTRFCNGCTLKDTGES